MRQASLERIDTIEHEERTLKIKKADIALKSAINEKLMAFNKSNDARGAKKFLLLGQKEFSCVRINYGKFYVYSIKEFEIPFTLGDGGFELWGMQIVLLPDKQSYMEIGIDRESQRNELV